MTSFNQVTFSDIFVRQSQNTARLGFEIQFRSIKKRLDTELNEKKIAYNDIDKTLEPSLAGLKRERAAADKQRTDLTAYLELGRRNINKLSDIINKMVPALSDAASAVGPTAAADFNATRDQLNRALQGLQANSYIEGGFLDKVTKFKGEKNPSGIGDYSSYATLPDRVSAVGVFVSTSSDPTEVNVGLSRGLGETLGVLRYRMAQDFDLAKAKQEASIKKLKEIDKAIEKKDAELRLPLLKELQAMEKKRDSVLQSLSLSFEFAQANVEVRADRFSWNKVQKGSIMNLFV